MTTLFVFLLLSGACKALVSDGRQDDFHCSMDSLGSCIEEAAAVSLLQSNLQLAEQRQKQKHGTDALNSSYTVSQIPAEHTKALGTNRINNHELLANHGEHRTISTGFNGNNASVMIQDATCITNTGGTCMVQNCASWRGPTTCSLGRCFCAPGFCSTVEGQCVGKKNKLVKHNITFRNARYPDYVMYISSVGSSVSVSRSLSDQSSFDLFEFPDQEENGGKRGDDGPVEFLLGSAVWDMWVAAVQKEQKCTTGERGASQSCHTEYPVRAVPIQRLSSAPVTSLAVNILMAPEYEGQPNNTQSVMIESFEYPRSFFSVGMMSWDVDSSYGDCGAGCYWLPDPPLQIQLKHYRGPRCSFGCGAYGSGTPPAIRNTLFALGCGIFACAFMAAILLLCRIL